MVNINVINLYKKIIENYWNNRSFVLFKKPYEKKIYFFSQEEKSKKENNFFLIVSFNQNYTIKIYTKKIYFLNIENPKKMDNLIFSLKNRRSSLLIYSKKYKNLIEKTIETIKKNRDFEKIVLSRCIKIPFHNFYLKKTFQKLIYSYPNAFITLWYDFNHGFWIGASPELLVKCNEKELKTVALAGTIWGNHRWTKKEVEEHNIVIKYFVNFFKKFSGNLYVEKTRILNIGHLHHLETPISFYFLEKPNYFKILDDMSLTPSICGSPKYNSLNYIQKYEGYQRNFYTGYFGPVYDGGDRIELYLNLRCAKIKMDKKEFFLYAGSGITKDSEANKEYVETENKFKNILSQFIFD
ncbi:chorismate-binding protein [Blattabacterium cuenoti]|uniref:chorismate-binding protein n=1 Tax=Blattabacterium cuenoti TaxID=1653831 RepID=UPI00163B758D|nr:chorismate-binding protein [Blattabacterium cuenoti]